VPQALLRRRPPSAAGHARRATSAQSATADGISGTAGCVGASPENPAMIGYFQLPFDESGGMVESTGAGEAWGARDA